VVDRYSGLLPGHCFVLFRVDDQIISIFIRCSPLHNHLFHCFLKKTMIAITGVKEIKA